MWYKGDMDNKTLGKTWDEAKEWSKKSVYAAFHVEHILEKEDEMNRQVDNKLADLFPNTDEYRDVKKAIHTSENTFYMLLLFELYENIDDTSPILDVARKLIKENKNEE